MIHEPPREDDQVGLTRKMMSIGTVGLVDFRSDKERTAAYAKATRNQVRQQTAIMQQQLAAQQYAAQAAYQEQMRQAQQTPSAKAGWFPDQEHPGMLRWFDGVQWTNHRAPANPPMP